MCIYIGSEVMLANLLNSVKDNQGVSISDLKRYSEDLQKAINERVYIELNSYELNTAILKYSRSFREFQDKYYTNDNFELEFFNAPYTPQVRATLISTANTLMS